MKKAKQSIKKSSSKSKSSKSSSGKKNFATIAQYLVAKNKKTKYLKIQASPNAPKETKVLVKKLLAVLGTDVLFVNLFDADFKDSKGIPEFVKGSISVELGGSMDDEDEDEDDEESEDEDESDDEESDEDDEESEDEDEDDDELGF